MKERNLLGRGKTTWWNGKGRSNVASPFGGGVREPLTYGGGEAKVEGMGIFGHPSKLWYK